MNSLEKSQSIVDSLTFGEGVNFDSYLHPDDQAKVKQASHWREKLKDFQFNPQEQSGKLLPFSKAANHFRIRPSETTIHTGYNGHKKSLMLGYIQLGLISQSEKCLNVSLEMPPHITLDRQIKQFANCKQPSLLLHERFFDFVKDNLYIYDQIGTMRWKRVIAVCRYAIVELGVTQCFLDSLMKFGIKSKDHETQAEFVDELATLAKDTGAHIHLVSHSKKPSEHGEGKMPDKYDIAGSADISNLVDNVAIHFTDKSDGRRFDQCLKIAKQRNPESEMTEPTIGLDFESESLQFVPSFEGQFTQRMSAEDWENGRFN